MVLKGEAMTLDDLIAGRCEHEWGPHHFEPRITVCARCQAHRIPKQDGLSECPRCRRVTVDALSVYFRFVGHLVLHLCSACGVVAVNSAGETCVLPVQPDGRLRVADMAEIKLTRELVASAEKTVA